MRSILDALMLVLAASLALSPGLSAVELAMLIVVLAGTLLGGGE